jgi:hypothetical protein
MMVELAPADALQLLREEGGRIEAGRMEGGWE